MRRRARCAFRGLTALLLASLAAPAWTAPARPALCSQVAPGDSLRRLVAEAAPGSVFCLSPGIHQGPLRVEGPIAIWGEETAVLRSPGSGSTLEVEGEGALLQGFTIDGRHFGLVRIRNSTYRAGFDLPLKKSRKSSVCFVAVMPVRKT